MKPGAKVEVRVGLVLRRGVVDAVVEGQVVVLLPKLVVIVNLSEVRVLA